MFIQNGAAGLARRRRRYSKKGNPLPVYKNRAGLSVFFCYCTHSRIAVLFPVHMVCFNRLGDPKKSPNGH